MESNRGLEAMQIGNIVRHKETGLYYEVTGVLGYSCTVKDINHPYEQLSFLNKDLDIVLDESTEAFNVLFGEDE